jgi:capsular polysaccharide transport system permease protein
MAAALATSDPSATDNQALSGPVATPANTAGPPARTEPMEAIAVRPGRRPMFSLPGPRQRPRFSLGWLSFVAVVVLPTALAAVYYFLIAADQYVAELRFALRSAEPVPARTEIGWLAPSEVTGATAAADSYIVVQYIRSRAMVDDLARTLDLRNIYSTTRADWPARLHLPVSVERLVEYWKGQVDAFFDPTNGTVMVRVSAFTQHEALDLAQWILTSSEDLVNQLSRRARRNALQEAETLVDTAERRLSSALARLREFRDKERLIDPNKAADASEALADRLRDALVRARTERSTLRQYLRDDSPSVKLLGARIEALAKEQGAIESGVTESPTTRSPALSGVMGRYEELESERRFAENAYQHALEALDRARLTADRQQVYIADFVSPRLPEEALYPRRWRTLAIVFLVSFAVWAVGGLTLRSVRDHL